MDTVRYIGRREYFLATDPGAVRKYVRDLADSPCDSFFKVYEEGRFIGTFKIGHINWETRTGDAGIMIGSQEARGRNLSVRVMKLGLAYAFDTLGLWKIAGGCLSGNIRMQRCFERAGFHREGCVRRYMFVGSELKDHLLYGLLKEEYREGLGNENL